MAYDATYVQSSYTDKYHRSARDEKIRTKSGNQTFESRKIRTDIKALKGGKSSGCDIIYAEVIKASRRRSRNYITGGCVRCHGKRSKGLLIGKGKFLYHCQRR